MLEQTATPWVIDSEFISYHFGIMFYGPPYLLSSVLPSLPSVVKMTTTTRGIRLSQKAKDVLEKHSPPLSRFEDSQCFLNECFP